MMTAIALMNECSRTAPPLEQQRLYLLRGEPSLPYMGLWHSRKTGGSFAFVSEINHKLWQKYGVLPLTVSNSGDFSQNFASFAASLIVKTPSGTVAQAKKC